ncbi:hypothetical protein L3X38_035893 [Prunus dulcis]|uniref:Uncharacterized protein n=1 Tax=Prunus dulcis TaxID=3755 RepID=A0AAD4VKL1_PRUDU|nr:hypothetical protein L3X38_035893 [Prunus dulcis]
MISISQKYGNYVDDASFLRITSFVWVRAFRWQRRTKRLRRPPSMATIHSRALYDVVHKDRKRMCFFLRKRRLVLIRLVFEKTYESGLWFQGKSLSKYLSAKDAPKRFSYRVQNIARNSSWGLGHTQSAIWV